jgi:SAM-dependent methyltransferase
MAPQSDPKAFVDYYNKHNVIPVQQDLDDFGYFLFRRDYLYRTLGIPLRHLAGRRVIEFGPGGGYNAVATSHYKPDRYVFVDASKASLAQLATLHGEGKFAARQVDIVESDILTYQDGNAYDCVICEGVIPAQDDPEGILRKVASFTAPGGGLVITTTSAASFLSEICRRVLRVRIKQAVTTFPDQVALSARIFHSHLASLGTSTRPIDNWVIDCILHDFHRGKYVFTMLDALAVLGSNFDFYQSSPRFLIDGLWYKKADPAAPGLNGLLQAQYGRFAASLLDYRIPVETALRTRTAIDHIEALSRDACSLHDVILEANDYGRLDDFTRVLLALAKSLPEDYAQTRASVLDFVDCLPRYLEAPESAPFDSFRHWWGRGQQYVSFLRR